jgi:hypothetical protein
MAYRNVVMLVHGIETCQVAPEMARVNAILDDVKTVTAKAREEAERIDHAVHTTMNRIDDTADRMRSNVRAKTNGGGRDRPRPARRYRMDAALAA